MKEAPVLLVLISGEKSCVWAGVSSCRVDVGSQLNEFREMTYGHWKVGYSSFDFSKLFLDLGLGNPNVKCG